MQHYYAFNAQYFTHQKKRTAFELIASHSNAVQPRPNTVIYYGRLRASQHFNGQSHVTPLQTSAFLYLNAKHPYLQTIAVMQNILLYSTGYCNC
jgi:hypothetical protein